MKYTVFAVCMLLITLSVTECGKNTQVKNSEDPVTEGNENIQVKNSEEPTAEGNENAQIKDSEEPAANVKNENDIIIKYCLEGNCRCGDGACSAGSYCIKDMCVCGAHPDKGVIDYFAVSSNDYGEFTCVSYKHLGEGYGGDDYFYDFLCTKDKGCVTGYGKKYDESVDPDDLVETDSDDDLPFEERVYQKYMNTPELHIADTNSNVDDEYRKILADRYLDLNCGKKLPNELKIFDHRDNSHSLIEFDQFLESANIDLEKSSWTEPECSLRKACNDSGVTQEHIAEYVCDNAKKLDHTAYHDFLEMPVGLRCNRADGCTCGKTQCPKDALCKDGQCMYDLYYQHRVCPGDNWKSDRSDFYNYMSGLKENVKCDCLKDEFVNKEVCYGMCYWELYPSKMTRNDPCLNSKKNSIK